MKLLLLSNSTNTGSHFLEHARAAITALASGRSLCFIPYALDNWDSYTQQVRQALDGTPVIGAHEHGTPRQTILTSQVVFAGGGNTFRLLQALQKLGIVQPLAQLIGQGHIDYIGSSAGTNIAAPSIRTTNDMPIVEVANLASMGLVPFQINPHFTDAHVPGLMAETRRERIAQFHERNNIPVLGLREGTWLHVDEHTRTIGGQGGGVMLTRTAGIELETGDSVNPWWQTGTFDDQTSGS